LQSLLEYGYAKKGRLVSEPPTQPYENPNAVNMAQRAYGRSPNFANSLPLIDLKELSFDAALLILLPNLFRI